ncbi:iron-sulfur cluster-binding protein [archaeon]|nr:iron-sulfur cluster-binding protein [archaeon]
MSKVSVLKTEPIRVLRDYEELMDKAEFTKVIPKKFETILKINLSWSMYFPSCSTQPWQLDGVLRYMLDKGYKDIHPVENKTVVTDPWKGAKGNKWLPVLKKYKQKYEPLTEVKWIEYKPKGEILAMDKIFPHGHKIPEMFIGKNVVHLPTVKTHGHTTMTGAMKNAFGGLITQRRHHCHKMIHEVLVDLLQIQKEIHKGIFAVADGTVCGDGKGPRTMIPKVKDYLLASDDQVAIDAISAKMMGFDPMKIKFIKMAHDRGLGCGDVKQIDIVGEDISRVNFNFSTGKSAVIWGDQLMRNNSKFIERVLFHTPLFKMCIFGSEFYHDKLWYPTIGKSRINRFMKTKWGKLFRQYES